MSSQDGLKALLGETFITRDGKQVTFDERVKGNDLIGIYFSAHWCGPCKRFTPKLKECYEKWKNDGKKIEIIFASSDRDEKSFKEYFAEHGDYLSWKFEDNQYRQNLNSKYGIRGIPTLVIVDKNGKLVQNEADNDVYSSEEQCIVEWFEQLSIEDKPLERFRYGFKYAIHWDKNRYFEGNYEENDNGLDFTAHDGDKRTVQKTDVYQLGTEANIGDLCLAYWKNDSKWLNPGKVTKSDEEKKLLYVEFDDGDKDWMPFAAVHKKINVA